MPSCYVRCLFASRTCPCDPWKRFACRASPSFGRSQKRNAHANSCTRPSRQFLPENRNARYHSSSRPQRSRRRRGGVLALRNELHAAKRVQRVEKTGGGETGGFALLYRSGTCAGRNEVGRFAWASFRFATASFGFASFRHGRTQAPPLQYTRALGSI